MPCIQTKQYKISWYLEDIVFESIATYLESVMWKFWRRENINKWSIFRKLSEQTFFTIVFGQAWAWVCLRTKHSSLINFEFFLNNLAGNETIIQKNGRQKRSLQFLKSFLNRLIPSKLKKRINTEDEDVVNVVKVVYLFNNVTYTKCQKFHNLGILDFFKFLKAPN